METLRLLAIVSRPEFLPANTASLIIGISWSINPPLDFIRELVIPAILVFLIITLVSAIAAQTNTMFDFELDRKDSSKKQLVQALDDLGRKKLKTVIAIEFLFSAAFIFILYLIKNNLSFIFMWIIAVFLAYFYSAPPLRFKSKAFLAMITLMVILSVLPVFFVFNTFTSELDYLFLVFLVGQAFTVYGVIVPAEIRDYWGDKEMGVETLTVKLGLVKASFLGIILLSIGGLLCGSSFFLKFVELHNLLIVSLLVMIATYGYVLKKYVQLFILSRKYLSSNNQDSIKLDIITLSANNPKWITLVTQTIVFISIILLLTKFLF